MTPDSGNVSSLMDTAAEEAALGGTPLPDVVAPAVHLAKSGKLPAETAAHALQPKPSKSAGQGSRVQTRSRAAKGKGQGL